MRPLRAGIFLKAVGPAPLRRRAPAGPGARFVRAPLCVMCVCVCSCALLSADASLVFGVQCCDLLVS